jgi:hypothetical protein
MTTVQLHPEMQSAWVWPIGFLEGRPGQCHCFVVKSHYPLRIVAHLKAVE